jgi:flagellin
MPQIINTNIASLNAQRNLNRSQDALSVSLQRLSSGLRINSAKDDAAGLAIAERFTTQIRGLNQAVRNANDGTSLSQTAEGALGELTNNLQRVRELAVQSANATNSASDRAALQNEVSQLVSEIDRVAQQTKFNGVSLLDGTFVAQQFQVGADANQTISIANIANAKVSVLGGTLSTTYASTTLAATGAPTGALAAGDLLINGRDIGVVAQDARLIVNAISAQSGLTSVTATASASASGALGAFTSLTGTAGGSANYSVVVGGVTVVNTGIQALTDSGALGAFTTVTGTTLGSATYTLTVGGVNVVNAVDPEVTTIDAAYVDAQVATNAAALTAAGVSYTGTAAAGTLQFTKANGTNLTISETLAGNAANGFASIAGGSNTYTPVYTDGTSVVNGAYIDAQLTANAAGLAAAGVTYTGTAAAGTLAFTKSDGSNLVLTETLSGDAVGGITTTINGGTTTDRGTITLAGTGANGIAVSGAAPADAGAGITAANSQVSTQTSNYTAALDTVDISSVAGANAGISIVDSALNSINSSRAALGAIQNRFSSVVANLQTTAENLSFSRSRILDADFAAETASLTRAQIMQQAGIAILSQANALPQSVLALLK